jgi:DNA-binding NarL/FixJ family response regulator
METAMPGASIKLLIAEDSELIRSGLTRFLERFDDVEVVAHASDGRTAVQLACEETPDVVLMDLHMPVMDGVDATRRIKDKVLGCRVLILSSFSDDDEVCAAFAAGADGYCIKSINMQQLYNAVKSVASGMSWLDPSIAERVLRGPLSPNVASNQAISGDSPRLSEHEVDVLSLLCEGLDAAEIARRQRMTPDKLKTLLHGLLAKLALSDRTKAAVLAIKQGLV